MHVEALVNDEGWQPQNLPPSPAIFEEHMEFIDFTVINLPQYEAIVGKSWYHGFHLSTCTNEPVGEDLCARCEAVVEKK